MNHNVTAEGKKWECTCGATGKGRKELDAHLRRVGYLARVAAWEARP